MHILCLGLRHRTAPVAVRERLALSPLASRAVLTRFGCLRESRPNGISELAILSTCNRLELYAVTDSDQFECLADFLNETTDRLPADFTSWLYRCADAAAVSHLCCVAAGLDSMILGEPQILGQVTVAFQTATAQGAAGPILSALFRTAIRAGKRARTETAIRHNPASVGSVAVKLAEAVIGDLSPAHVLVVGAGEMAELAVKALRARGMTDITVVNRTPDRAARLAGRWGARTFPFERLQEAIAAADMVITSTGAPHLVITHDMASTAVARRPTRPLVFVDIAVPRDVDPEVACLPNVHCYDLDDLQARLNDGLAERAAEVPRVEAIVAEEAGEYTEWLRGQDIRCLIADLRAKAESIRRAEVEKTLRHLSGLGEAERRRVNALTEALVNKVLHDMTLRLKVEAGGDRADEYVAAVRYLHALNR